MGRKRGSATERKQQIIEAAMRCFQSKGYENTTIDDIAAEYGLSKGSIYWYYASKKEILIDLFHYWMEELFKGISEKIMGLESPRERIIQMGLFFVENLQEDLQLFRTLMVIWSTAFEDESIKKMNEDLYRQYEDLLMAILTEGEKKGEFKTPDKRSYSAFLVALGDGILVRQILNGDLNLKKIGKDLRHVIWRILPPPGKK